MSLGWQKTGMHSSPIFNCRQPSSSNSGQQREQRPQRNRQVFGNILSSCAHQEQSEGQNSLYYGIPHGQGRFLDEKADKINKELVEKISLQAIPGITDRIIEEIIQGPLMAEFKNAIEKVVEQKIPYIVERIITEEIEKIKTEDK